MSSTNKTANLKLNQWIASDCPKMQDFNNDNGILDSAITSHTGDTNAHVTASDKNVWNHPFFVKTYYGDGSASRSLTIGAGFAPSWGIVFSTNFPPGVTDFTNKAHYNYFGIFSTSGSTPGLTLSSNTLKLVQSTTPVNGNEYRSYNENAVSYVAIFFR